MKTILFQGDSITDAGRREERANPLGNGYVRIAADYFAQNYLSANVINRGVSGNRTIDLVNRWKEDCISLRPDVLTILVGINDCWRKYDNNDETPIEAFEKNYDAILSATRERTNAHIILMEPFVLPYPKDRIQWRETLDPEIQVIRKLAKKYRTKLIPLDSMFAVKSIKHDYAEIAPDGVHPTGLGHKMIFNEWLRAYNTL